MRIDSLRKLDNRFGPIICRSLFFIRSITWLFLPPSRVLSTKELRDILVMKFYGMGSILLASPSIRELKKKYRSAKVTIFTLRPNLELCGMLDSMDDVICLNTENPFIFLKSLCRSIFDIQKKDFDVIIDLEFLTNFPTIVILLVTLFKNNAKVVGFGSPNGWRNRVYDVRACFDHSKHIMKIFAKTISGLTGKNFEPSLEMEKASLAGNGDRGLFKRIAGKGGELGRCNFFICVNIGASELSLQRRWPKDYFAYIVNHLIKRPDTAIFLMGSGAEAKYVSEFEKMIPSSPRIVNICGKTSLGELIGLFLESDLLVTNDSGPLHFAVAIGLPTVSFFGPETPYLYGPTSGRHRVFYEDLYCSPCLTIYNSKMNRCRDNICLKSISPEKALKVIEDDFLLAEDRKLSAKQSA